MKTKNLLGKTLLSTLAFTLYFHGATSAYAVQVSQQPLMLVESVAPNLIFTLDNSTSMRRAYVPDDLGNANTRRAKSSTFNAMYYNPATTYILPKKADGTEYTTSFGNARKNGFGTGSGDNLATSYRPTWGSDTSYGQNPEGEYLVLSSMSVSLPSGQTNNVRIYDGSVVTSSSPLYPFALEYRFSRPSGNCRVTVAGQTNRTCNTSSNNATIDLRSQGVRAYYYVFDTSLPSCNDNLTTNDDCYRHQEVLPEEETNFAIWYSFYRSRALATNTAAHIAFYDLPSSIRFTWQDLNTSNDLNSRFKVYNSSHKSDFYSWLQTQAFSLAGTPLRSAMRRAGTFLESSSAWVQTPGQSGGTVHACRPSFHITMTDGLWNSLQGSSNLSLPARHDKASFTLEDGTEYSGTLAPYPDSETHQHPVLADYAMHYWATDLRPGLDDEVKPYTPFPNSNSATQYWDPRNNPATWQHMVNYIVSLGLTNSLTDPEWTGSTFSGPGYQALKDGTKAWPSVGSNPNNNTTEIGKVYDLWHAAINSRGEFFSAESPEDMVKAFNDIINRIAERTATAAKPGVSTSVGVPDPDDPYQVDILNRLFYSAYDSTDWSGDLTRYDLRRNVYNGSIERTLKWSAKNSIGAPSNRAIKIVNASGTGLVDFSYLNLGSHQDIFNRNPDSTTGSATDNRGEERVAYLRGDRTAEGESSTHFRQRSSVLGDIVNSSPVLVGAPSYLPYLADKIDGTAGDYRKFYEDNKSRRELVYVGANDGMLHAFDAENGDEVFAFVPSVVLPNMPKLTGQSYQGGAHLYFVDGTPVVRDVYIGDKWRTILIGTLRAGGKSLFALDITDPGDISLLWEVSNQTPEYENLGYTFAQPEIVRLHSGQWAVLMGNGYDSTNDVASLFVIDIEDGTLLRELVVDNGTNGANGLSSVRGADNNGDGVADYAYAGDLRGNLWRFDLINHMETNVPDPFARSRQIGVTPAAFATSYGGSPLYTARDTNAAPDSQVQAITAIPSLVRHPTRRGYIVMFGTGKYFETADAAPDTSRNMSVYGIWDRKTRAEPTTISDAGTLTRQNLQQQLITAENVTNFERDDESSINREVRTISQERIQWYVPNTTPAQEVDSASVSRWGWYVDLSVNQTLEGEMMVNPMLARGDTLLFSSLIPNEDPCADGTTSWIYAINAHTGGRTRLPALDFNSDGRFDGKDTDGGTVVSGYKSDAPGGISLSKDGLLFGSSDSIGFNVSPELQGRQSWHIMPLED